MTGVVPNAVTQMVAIGDPTNPANYIKPTSGGAFPVAATVADGADVAQGATTDAAATDSTSAWSEVALLKGLIAQAISTQPAPITRSDSYNNITSQTTTLVKSGAGTLASLSINTPLATGVITIYDSTTASGTKIATITQPATAFFGTLAFNVAFATGLTVVTGTATQDITVSYR